jgi:hypothetical protein
MCLLALLLARVGEDDPGPVRLLLLTGGLFGAGIALAIRLSSRGPAFCERMVSPSRNLLLSGLAGLFTLLALTTTAIVVVSLVWEPSWLPWKFGMALILWFVTAPLGVAAALRALRLRRQGTAVTAQEESAVMLVLTALCGFVACWALYLPDDPTSWDTMRLALAVFTAVALLAAPLALASTRVRRWTISVLVVLHFCGIVTATLSPPPSPQLIGQTWTRIFRPYLEFMYLNNAYHFYSPEPGPASHLWCRLIYADPADHEYGEWFKVPDVDEKGQHRHRNALEYQRHLALTEYTVPSETTGSFFVIHPNGMQDLAPFVKYRQQHSPMPNLPIGQESPSLVIPFHPLMPTSQQYSKPNPSSQRLLSSYVRHVVKAKCVPDGKGDYVNAEHPDWRFKLAKLYRVRHDLPTTELYARMDPPLDANDPELYRPFYMGQYDADGNLVGKADPFLYWLLPILRTQAGKIDAPIRDYARLHAGDPYYTRVKDGNTYRWVTKDEAMVYEAGESVLPPP